MYSHVIRIIWGHDINIICSITQAGLKKSEVKARIITKLETLVKPPGRKSENKTEIESKGGDEGMPCIFKTS